jgi:hypothetical protein
MAGSLSAPLAIIESTGRFWAAVPGPGNQVRDILDEALHGDDVCARERAGSEPRYRRLRDGIGSRHIGLRFAASESLERFLALVGC